jgi:hypothetical protein
MALPKLLEIPVSEIDEPDRKARGFVMTKSAELAVGSKTGGAAATMETVADILERELQPMIEEWLARVEKEQELTQIKLNHDERTGHLPFLMNDVISRLRLDAGTKAPISMAAGAHGELRHKQGYSVVMLVEESRLLQVSIFTTLHENVSCVEFNALLPNVVTIADEVDAQLKEQMLRFMAADAGEKAKGR